MSLLSGMGCITSAYETQVHIIELCVSCPTVKTFAVFCDKVHDKWADPDEGQSFEFPVISGCPGPAIIGAYSLHFLQFSIRSRRLGMNVPAGHW